MTYPAMTTLNGVPGRACLPMPTIALVVALGGRVGASGVGRVFDHVQRFVRPLEQFDLPHLCASRDRCGLNSCPTIGGRWRWVQCLTPNFPARY
ncbi:hypothetical protein [Micromonospora sp. DT233]|uniref:hypothetical protein n=1 Tax=Micromonospora sp. DT233 TaxID=3393432 RepID=UPI003CF284E6